MLLGVTWSWFRLGLTPLLIAIIAGCGNSSSSSHPLGLHRVADVPLGGGTQRVDYQSLDGHAHRLYLARLGNGQMTVFDTKAQRVTGTVPNLPGVHGVLAVPKLGRVYVAVTDENQLAAIDMRSLSVLVRVPAGEAPDGIAYDPDVHKLFVSDEGGSTDAVIDATTNRRIGLIDVGDDVGNTQYDPVSHHIFIAAGDRLVEVNPVTNRVVRRYSAPGCQGAHGLLIDAAHGAAFMACEDNAMLLVYDLRSMRVIARDSVGETPDVLALDPSLRHLYVASESGVLAVLQEQSHGVRKLAQAFVGPNAHTVAVDPSTHRVYLPLADLHDKAIMRVMQPNRTGTG